MEVNGVRVKCNVIYCPARHSLYELGVLNLVFKKSKKGVCETKAFNKVYRMQVI